MYPHGNSLHFTSLQNKVTSQKSRQFTPHYLLAVAVASFVRHLSPTVSECSAVNGFWSVELSKVRLGASH
jgi:hypothetical protein